MAKHPTHPPVLLETEKGEFRCRPLRDGVQRAVVGPDCRPKTDHAAALKDRIPLFHQGSPEVPGEPARRVVNDGGSRPRSRQEGGQGAVNLLLLLEDVTRSAAATFDRHGGRTVGRIGRRHRTPRDGAPRKSDKPYPWAGHEFGEEGGRTPDTRSRRCPTS